MERNYQSTIKAADHKTVLNMCDDLYLKGLTYDNIAAVMRNYDLDPEDCYLGDVMVAVRNILGHTLGEYLEYDAFAITKPTLNTPEVK